MFKNLTVAMKLGFGFGCMLLLLAGTLATALLNMARMEALARATLEDRYAKVSLANEMSLNTLDNGRQLRNVLLTDDEGEQRRNLDLIEKHRNENTQLLGDLGKLINTERGRELYQDILEARERLDSEYLNFYNLLRTNRAQAREFVLREFAPTNDRYLRTLRRMANFQDDLMEQNTRLSAESHAFARIVMISVGVAGLLVATLLAFGIARGLIRQLGGEPTLATELARRAATGDLQVNIALRSGDTTSLMASLKLLFESMKQLAVQADAIGKGDLSREVVLLSEHDQIGNAVNKMTRQLREARTEDERRNWVKDGYSQLSAACVGDLTMQQLADTAIASLCRHLAAGRGVFYLYAAATSTLDLLGSYMYTERAHVGDCFRLGEGAIGQVAREKKPIILTTVGPDAPPIVTGTTAAPPLYTCTYPLLREGVLLGVVELASFEPFDPVKREFLSGAADLIALFLYGCEQKERIRSLLAVAEAAEKETSRQNQLLQEANVQMEEQQQQLQQQSEELQASNAQLEEQQQQLQQQSEEMELSNAQLEEQQKILEQRNRELMQTQRELDDRARQLEQSGQYKSEFLANMSHELRTPLNSIILLSRMMANNENGRLSEEEAKKAEVIHRSGQDLLHLIDDVLDLSKVEAGRMDVHVSTVASAALLSGFHEEFEHTARDKGLDFTVQDHLRGDFVTDPDKLAQIVRNLLSNAFKFTRAGGVTLTLERRADRTHPLSLRVCDTGVGIPPDKQALVFEAFQQADGSTSREFGGTGLGLTISRRLARLLGGDIVLHSNPGEGSEFSLLLPAPPASGAPAAPPETTPAHVPAPPPVDLPAPPGGTAVRDDRDRLAGGDPVILLIDDDARFGATLVEINQKLGYKTLVAGTGQDGLALAHRYRPNGILLDLGLPDMDGSRVLHEIKASRELADIPVYIVSARDRDAALMNQGIVGYLRKPVNESQIAEAEAAALAAAVKAAGGAILVVASGGISAAEIRRIVGPDLGPILEATPDAAPAAARREPPCRLAIIDLNGPSLDASLDLARTLRTIRDDIALLFFSGRPLSDADEARLRPYSDSIILRTPQAERRLLENIERFFREVPKTRPLPPPPRSTAQRLAGRQILVVDDDPRNLFVVTAALEQNGAQVSNATNGHHALTLLEQRQPDLILMDIMMPELDGYQTIAAIRATPALAAIPVLALTAKAMLQDRENALAAGADDYLSKPVDYDTLINACAAWCAQRSPA